MENNTPLSRVEDILQSTIDNTEYDKPPQSRVESLLIELKEVIEGGGGGGSAYHPAGSVDYVSELPSPSADYLGYVYDITQAFTTTSDFKEGAGKRYPAGSNIAIVDVGTPESPSYKYDVLSGFIDTSNFVEKEEGKGLSTNDYTNADKTKLASLENYDDTEIRAELDEKADNADLVAVAKSGSYNDLVDTPDIPNKTSDLTNDSHFVNETQMDAAIDSTDISSSTTGINPTITDSADGYIQNITVYGRSEVSKNIWNDDVTTQSPGVTRNDHEYTFEPFESSTEVLAFPKTFSGSNTYTFSFEGKSESDGTVIRFDGQPDGVSGLGLDKAVVLTTAYTRYSFSGDVDSTYYALRFYRTLSNVGHDKSINIRNIQLELGSTPTTYEPYGIISIGDSGELNVQTCGKNLFDKGAEHTAGETLSVTTGEPVPNVYFTTYTDYIPCAGNTTYVMSAGENSNTICAYRQDKTYISGTSNYTAGTTTPLVFTTPAEAAYLRVSLLVDQVNSAQLEIGSTATAYEPYVSTSATVTTGIPLYAVGDVKDELDEKRGVVVKRCGAVDLGDLEWTYSGGQFTSQVMPDLYVRGVRLTPMLCTDLQVISDGRPYADLPDKSIYTIYIDNDGNKHGLVCINRTYTTVYDFIQGVTGIKLIYILAEPYEIPLTSSELSALRGLRTYNSTTNVTVTDDPTVDVGYILNTDNGQAVADVQNGLKDQINEVEAGLQEQIDDKADKTELQTAALLAFQSVCPNNEILYDDLGQPSVMVRLPKQSWVNLGIGTSTDTFPAWIINGQEVDEICFSKYQNVTVNSRACSLPAKDPRTTITLDQAITASNTKGAGWHCMTRLEWMAVALWCLKNGFQPNGNNNYGKDISETIYKAVPTHKDGIGRISRVATGTGLLSWSHDCTINGIWDMNGNVWEWNGGIRLVQGELQVLSNDGLTFGNDAADSDNSQAASSSLWRAINGKTGTLIVPNGSGTTENSLKAEWTGTAFKWITGALTTANKGIHSCTFETITADEDVCETAQHFLMALGLLKSDNTAGIYNDDNVELDTAQDERVFIAGGVWDGGVQHGVFAADGYNDRSYSGEYVGFRASYYKKEGE